MKLGVGVGWVAVAATIANSAGAVERERLLAQATARNRVLETIREMLETLAGAGAIDLGLTAALQSLRRGLRADQVALLIAPSRRPTSATTTSTTPRAFIPAPSARPSRLVSREVRAPM